MKDTEGIVIGRVECFNTPFACVYQINFEEDIKLAAFQEDI